MADFYQAKDIEEKLYKIWEGRVYFEIDRNKNIRIDEKFFCIIMSPPSKKCHKQTREF